MSSRRTRYQAGDREAGAASTSVYARCPIITRSVPASIPARNGTAFVLPQSSKACGVVGMPWCESAETSPCPGKCLSVVSAKGASPATAASTRAAAASGDVPSTREAMNDDASSVSSATIPKFRLTPSRASRAPRPANARSVRSGSSCASAPADSNASQPIRETTPPS